MLRQTRSSLWLRIALIFSRLAFALTQANISLKIFRSAPRFADSATIELTDDVPAVRLGLFAVGPKLGVDRIPLSLLAG